MPNERGEHNGPEITIERDAYGLTLGIAGKREIIVLDDSEVHGTRLFIFDDDRETILSQFTFRDQT